MRQDFRFAWRMILTHRWFSAAVIATLAFGIGMNTMVFTLIDAALFKPVPVPGGERLISMLARDIEGPPRARTGLSYPDFLDYRAQTKSLEALEAGTGDGAILSEKDIAPQRYGMFRVSSGFFAMIHLRPLRGRDFTDSDVKIGAAPVALIGYSVWQERYGGRDVIGRMVRINAVPTQIIGVMPQGIRFPNLEDIWVPLQATAEMTDRSNRPLQLFGVLKPGVPIEQASADMTVISRRLAAEYPKDDKRFAPLVQTFHDRYNGDQIRFVFLLMMAAVGFVLLIVCANVANMLLGRALARRREISIRAALGASRGRIVRQLLVEALMLSMLGGVVGLGLAVAGIHAFDLGTQDVGKPYWVQFRMDYRVFFYFAVVCVASALIFGFLPALRSSGARLVDALKDGSRSAGSMRGGKLSGALVVFQFSLTLVLLLGAGVFMRTFVDAQSINRWIPSKQLLTARVTLPDERYKDPDSRIRFFQALLSRMSAIPGVTDAAEVSDLPGASSGRRPLEIESAPARDNQRGPSASVITLSPGYFKAIGLGIVRGRGFEELDGSPGHEYAIVTREFAGRFWGTQDPTGKRFHFPDPKKTSEWITVAGVSADINQHPLDPTGDPVVFLPYRQYAYGSMALMIRTANPRAAISALRSAVQDLDQDLPLLEVSTLAEFTQHQIWFLELFGTVFLVFAGMSLLISSVGIYAVMAQAAGSRTQEIGVRIALGATAGNILALVLRRGMIQLLIGLGIGVGVAIPAARVLSKLQFVGGAADSLLIGGVALVLSAVGVFACWLPARRAALLDPVSAIRDE
jgi:predicted permease